MLQRIKYALRLIKGHWNYPLIGSSHVNHNNILIFIWGAWHSGIACNTQNLKVLSSNPADGLGRDRLWDTTSL